MNTAGRSPLGAEIVAATIAHGDTISRAYGVGRLSLALRLHRPRATPSPKGAN
jgi:hypothetical protein